MSFMVLIGATATTPPSYATPASVGSSVIQNAPVVRRHEPTARSGNGAPVGVSGELFTTIGRTVINSTGLAWWYTTVGLSSNTSTPISVKLLDPITGTWKWYTGTAWRPTFSTGRAGNKLMDFTIHISNLSEIASPESQSE